MEKFLLLGCTEREIYVEGVFDTFLDAQLAMKESYVSYLTEKEISEEEIWEGDERGEEYDIETVTAWSNVDNINVDWKIEKIEI